MRKLSFSILAAGTALIAAPSFAQGGPHPGPPPGHSWRGGGGGGGMVGMPGHGPNVQVRMRHGGPGMHPGPGFRHQRLQRGFFIHPFWFGSQFQIGNWQAYGFSNPGDGQWVRYYDDAYLIGRDGRVMDTRYGMDWDSYDDEWEMDGDIPMHRGHGEWAEGDEDDDGGDLHGTDGDHRRHRGHHEGHGGGMMAMDGSGYGYSQGYSYGGGYGYGAYAYPIVIETITTTGGGYSEEVVEEYVEVRHRARAHRRARCVCAAPRPAPRRPAPRPRPRPPAGERG